MKRDEIADLAAFVTVAREGSFTRAAKRLGMSQSGMSQVIRRLEERLDLRLLDRTTRSVAPTAAGAHLLATAGPLLEGLEGELTALSKFRDEVAGIVRITSVEHAAKTILVPAVAPLLEAHPELEIEIVVDHGLRDIVSDRFDAGVRLGQQVAKDMVAVRLSPDVRMAVVGSPAYFERHRKPKRASDLVDHRCINLRLPTSESLYAWRFIEKDKEVRVHVQGPLVLNTVELIRDAALAGVGLAHLPWDQVEDHVRAGELVSVLTKALRPLPGYFLYYPSRRHVSPAFRLVVDAMRHRKRR